MRILVSGAAGFLGSHLVDRLLAEGNEVLGVDNLLTGSKRNLEHLQRNPHFEFLRHDITFPMYVEVDAIYNLASPASPKHYQKDPVQTLKTNVVGSVNVLGLAKRLDVPIFQASTSEVYGDPEVHPQREEYWGRVNPIGPRACYDEGKRAAETLFFDYFRQHNVRIRVCRIFNTYGPRMAIDDGRVISNFIVQALRGEDITIFGDGNHTRSFCFVNDLISGFLKVMNQGVVGPTNLGNPEEVTIKELADIIINLVESKSKTRLLPLPQDDPKQRRPDISKAKAEMDWSPDTSLEQGLLETISYFRYLLAK